MMLYYKAWRESRARFLISASFVAAFCLIFVLLQGEIRGSRDFMPWTQKGSYSQHIYQFIYGTGHGIFLAIIAPFLGLGGLLHEKARGTASFTLSLPVSRSRALLAQVIVGMGELAFLALLPALLVPSLSPLVHQSYPLSQALHFSVLWFICGGLMFSVSFFFASMLRGEYTATVAAVIALVAEDFLTGPLGSSGLYRWKILWIGNEFGTMHWNQQRQQLLSGPLPWVSLETFVLVTVILLAAAFRISQKQDL